MDNRSWQFVLTILSNLALTTALYAQTEVERAWRDLPIAETTAIAPNLIREQTTYRRAIAIDKSYLEAITPETNANLELAPGSLQAFDFLFKTRYANGDIGWRGRASESTQHSTFSLVYNADSLVASVSVDGQKFKIRASTNVSSPDVFVGYVYTPIAPSPLRAIDSSPDYEDYRSGTESVRQRRTLSESDITIEQVTDREDAYLAGDEVEITINLANKTQENISGKKLAISSVLDNTELLNLPENCSVEEPDSAEPRILCDLDDINAERTLSVNYTVKVSGESYPFVRMQTEFDTDAAEPISKINFFLVSKDTLLDSDEDGYSDFNEAILDTDPMDPDSVFPPDYIAEIDVLVLYTPLFVEDIGEEFALTKLNQMIESTNSFFAESDALVSFNPVHYQLVEYDAEGNTFSPMTDMREGNAPFEFLAELRSQLGADIVALIDGYYRGGSFCGRGTLGGFGTNGELSHPATRYELYSFQFTDGSPDDSNPGCDDIVLAHEFGHNLGLHHSRRDLNRRATYPFALGHGVEGVFNTIMTYSSRFPGAGRLPLFSNPRSLKCKGRPCGVSREDTFLGADSSFAINQTRIQLATRRDSRELVTRALSGETQLRMFGAATTANAPDSASEEFRATEEIDVSALLLIPDEHQTLDGFTYVVVSIANVGLFFLDTSGEYQAWDGDLTTLGPYTDLRPLNPTERLDAYDNFTFDTVDLNSAEVTVYFAYSIPELDIFAYSEAGVSFKIR